MSLSIAKNLLESCNKSNIMDLANKLGLFDDNPKLRESGLGCIKNELARCLTLNVESDLYMPIEMFDESEIKNAFVNKIEELKGNLWI